MGFSKLTTNLNNHQSLNDEPNLSDGMTAEQLKVLYDKAPNDIKEYINNLIDAINDKTSAGNVGAKSVSDGTTSSNVQAELDYLLSQLQGIVLGQIPDGTITEPKMNNTYANSLAKKSYVDIIGKYNILTVEKVETVNEFTIELPTLENNQRIIIKTPTLNMSGVTSNTLNTYTINQVLQGNKKYELIWNGTSFDVKNNVVLDITLSESISQIDISNVLEENGIYAIEYNGNVSYSDFLTLRNNDNNSNYIAISYISKDAILSKQMHGSSIIFISNKVVSSIGYSSAQGIGYNVLSGTMLDPQKACLSMSAQMLTGTNIQIRRLD